MNGELNSSFELTFTLHHSNNDLIFETNRLTDRQIMLYEIISYLHNEMNWSYRKITKKFNDEWKIKTHKGKKWGVSGNSVYSVLKRFGERERRLQRRHRKSDSVITEMKLRTKRFIVQGE